MAGKKEMNIRPAKPSDVEGIAAIHTESWMDAYVNDLPEAFFAGQIHQELSRHWRDVDIQNEDILLVAEEDLLVGFVAVWCRPIPFIDNLHVKPSHRSKKLGTALLQTAVNELINKGYNTGYLWVFESNEKAIRFYERLGGVKKEKASKSIFGYDVPSLKIEWDNLAVICENA
jgi:ribosomal protein S18 acetylase RimI-like enzyme